MSAPTPTDACPFYLTGTCRRGKSCKLSHGAEAPKSSKTVCTYFLQQKCVYGSKCKLQHTEPSSASKPPSKPASKSASKSASKPASKPTSKPTSKPAPKSATRKSGTSSENDESSKSESDVSSTKDTPEKQDQAIWGSGWDMNGADDTSGSSSQEDDAQSPTKPPCFFFSQGLCGKGDECEFAHTTTPSTTDGTVKASDSTPKSTPSKKKPEPKVCKYYVRGSCRAGDDCRLKHVLPAVDKSSNVAGSESSEVPSDWDSGPSKETADVSASDGPEADDQPISFFNGDANTERVMHQPDPDVDDADDMYGDRNQDDNDNDDDDDNNDDEPEAENETLQDADESNQQGDDEDENEGNREVDTTLIQNDRAPSSGYASSRSNKEPNRRGSWYGSGWDDPALSSASAPSSASLYPHTSESRLFSPAVPQSIPAAVTAPPPVVQPHWSQFADPQADARLPFCKPHAQALCAQGAACRFRHFLTPEEYTLLFHDPQPNLWTFEPKVKTAPPVLIQAITPVSVPVVTVNQAGTTYGNDAANPSTQPTTKSSVFARECSFYQLGTCRNAERCPYLHTQHPVSTSPSTAKADQGWAHSSSGNYRDKIDAPCRFFVEKGYCRREKDCKFRHDEADRTENSQPAWPSDNNNNDDNGNNGNNNDTKDDADTGGWDNNDDTPWSTTANTNADSWNTASGWGDTPSSGWDDKPATTWQTTKKGACRQFTQEGHCRWGNSCRFSHDVEPTKKSGGDELPAEDASQSTPFVVQSVPCRFYARGKCGRGKDCPDRHDLPGKESPDIQENSPASNEHDDDGTPEENWQSQSNDPPEEAHWTASWNIDDTPAQIAPGSINKPCKMFAQGFCRFGDDCGFKHGALDSDPGLAGLSATMEADLSERPASPADDDDNNYADDDQESNTSEYIAASPPTARESEIEVESQLQPIIFHHPMVSRFWEQCTIVYGENITPTSVTTLADSKKLVLSNLPVDVAPADITRLASPYGEIVEIISLEETVHSAVIQIEFADAFQAYEAFNSFDGLEYESNVISAALKGMRTVPIKRSVGQKIYAKVSWLKPSKRAWSHYPTISKAKQQADDLNNVIIRGRAIKASFVSPAKAQKTAFAVLLQNLDPETTKSELEAVCSQCELITMDPPIYSEDATDEIKSLFDELGPTEQFDLLPTTNGATSTAFVTFKSEAVAAEVVSKLQSHPLPILGRESLSIRGVHYARYCISNAHFEAVQSEIDNLRQQSDGSKKCIIQCDDHRNGQLVWIRIHASYDSSTSFADTNSELLRVLQGIVIMSQGKEVWDEYFETKSSANTLEQIQNRTNALIQCDLRAKRIRIFGSKASQTQAQASILKGLSKIHDLRNEIKLPRHKLHPLVNGGYKTLQTAIGANKVSLDVVNSKLIVLGIPEEVSKANNTISLLDDESSSASGGRNTCQICHHSAVDPVLLSCHHAYCTTCLQFAIRQKRTAPFQCISLRTSRDGESKQCSAHVPYIILHDILSGEEDQVLQATFHAYVRSRPDELFFCPSLDCPAVHRVRDEGVNIKCTLCVSELCTYCKSLAHIGTPCATRA